MNTIDPAYYHLTSERLYFRELSPSDIILWEPFFVENNALRFVGSDDEQIAPSEKAATWINRQFDRKQQGNYHQLAICLRENDTFIGVGGLISRETNGKEELEVSYSLLQTHQGKGYATELARRFIDFGFMHLKRPSLISLIHPENDASINVARKNGLREDGMTTYMDTPVIIFRIQAP